MHSARLSNSWTSLRLNSSVLSVCIRSSDQTDNVIAGFCFYRDFTAFEDSGAGFAFQCHGVVFANQPRLFANSDDRCLVLLEKLKNPFFLGLAHVSGIRVRVLKMWADLKWHQTQRVE